jgi:hypothetical protein
MRPSKERLLEVVTYVEPGSDDVTFTHAVFAQCFLPIRKLPKSQKLYEVRHGRAALAVLAGALLEPASKRFVAMDIPSGSAARVALAQLTITSSDPRASTRPWPCRWARGVLVNIRFPPRDSHQGVFVNYRHSTSCIVVVPASRLGLRRSA